MKTKIKIVFKCFVCGLEVKDTNLPKGWKYLEEYFEDEVICPSCQKLHQEVESFLKTKSFRLIA